MTSHPGTEGTRWERGAAWALASFGCWTLVASMLGLPAAGQQVTADPIPLPPARVASPRAPAPAAVARALADLEAGTPFAVFAARDLARWGAAAAVPALERWARGERGTRGNIPAACVHARAAFPGARPFLESLLETPAARPHLHEVVRALRSLGDPAARPALERVQAGSDEYLVHQALAEPPAVPRRRGDPPRALPS